jgi:hypothetical protein
MLLPPSVARAVRILDEVSDDQDIDGNAATMDWGQDPGAFVVDFAMRQGCRWECLGSEDFDTCSELNHPIGDISAIYIQNFQTWGGAQAANLGFCGIWEDAHVPAQNLVNAQITAVVPDPITMWAAIAGDIARAIDRAHFTSRLTVDPPVDGSSAFIHEMLEMIVVVHDLSGAEHTVTFDVLAAGLDGRPRGEAMLRMTGGRVDIDPHSFDLDFGRLVAYVYLEGILPVLGYGSTAEMLDAWIDCAAVGTSLASSVGILSAAQYETFCDGALTAGGLYFDTALDGLVASEGVLMLEGSAVAGTLDASGAVERLNTGMWTGGWGEDTETGDITGTFTGVIAP